MIKNLNTGNFFIPESEQEPVVLFIFNQYQDDIEDVKLTFNKNILNIHYPSDDIIFLEITEKRIYSRINSLKKMIVIEADELDGEIIALYEAEIKKPD